MLNEYALTPDIFIAASYTKHDYIDMCLPNLKQALLDECSLVRDLGDGAWSHCIANGDTMHRRAREILRKLQSANRLRPTPRFGTEDPKSSEDWCAEALASYGFCEMTGVITSAGVKEGFRQQEVASIEKLAAAEWWQKRRSTATVARQTATYLQVMSRVMAQANSLMFIDPYLDPSKHNYREFHLLLAPLGARCIKPIVEIHRSERERVELGREAPRTLENWQDRFSSLDRNLRAAGLPAKVFCWPDFHWRYLITDIAGFQVDAGFDVSNHPNAENAWARIDRLRKDELQREYDPAYRYPTWSFDIGG